MGSVDTLSIGSSLPSASRRRRATTPPAQPEPYVGADRRGLALTRDAAETRVLVPILLLLAAVWVTTEAAILSARTAVSIDVDGLGEVLDAVVVALAAVVALLAFVRWRLTGEARPLFLAAGAIAFGPVAIGLGELVPRVADSGHSTLAAMSFAGRFVGGLAFIAAALWHEVDARLAPRWVLGAAPALAAATGAAVLGLAGGSTVVSGPTAALAVAVTMAIAAGFHTRAARFFDRASHATIATAAGAIALAELTTSQVTASSASRGALLGAFVLGAAGFVLLVGRGLRDLEIAFVTQRARLLETEIGMEAEAARRRAQEMAHQERAHDARNSLLAIEGASVTLERYRDRLAPERRTQLAEAMTGEIARLQHLISGQGSEAETFDVARLLEPIVAAEDARGLVVEIDIPEGLTAFGRSAETVEVVRNLVNNARNYAPGSPVTIRAGKDGAWTTIYVEDRGQGIERAEREAIFERGHRGLAAPGTTGSGLGLYISRRLMQDQGGDVWAESRGGGGASFGLCLPTCAPGPEPEGSERTS